MYYFIWFNSCGDSNIYSFGYSPKITGHVPFDSVEFLTPEEIGQELGGN